MKLSRADKYAGLARGVGEKNPVHQPGVKKGLKKYFDGAYQISFGKKKIAVKVRDFENICVTLNYS